MQVDIANVVLNILLASGGATIVAYQVFKMLGSSWLENKFGEKLEAFRHEKAKELEKLRADIDGSLRARLRLQERQFESVVSIWDDLKSAQEKLAILLSPLQSYSDIRRMDDEARSEYIQSFDLQEWQKREILSSEDIQKSFSSMIDHRKFVEAVNAFNAFDRATRSSEIFFSEEAFLKLRLITVSMHSALVDKELSLNDSDRKLSLSAWETYEKDCIPKISEFASFARKFLGEQD